MKQLLNSDIGQTNAIAKLASDFFQDFANTPFLVHARACGLLKTLESLKKLTTQFVKNAAAQQDADDIKEALSEWGFHRNRKYPYGGQHYIPMQQATENITLALALYKEYVAGSVITRNRVINELAGCLSVVSNALDEHIWRCVDLKDKPIFQQMYQDMVTCRKLLSPPQLDTVNPILENKPNIQGETNKTLKPDPTTKKNNRKLKRG